VSLLFLENVSQSNTVQRKSILQGRGELADLQQIHSAHIYKAGAVGDSVLEGDGGQQLQSHEQEGDELSCHYLNAS
jgi:hypothetical protein